VPPVDLADLAGPIARALEGPRCEEARTHLREMLLEDGDATAVAERTQVLAHDRGGHPRVDVEPRGDGVPEGVEL
jgi:hypothetical protein